ncbi:hypothetical protein ACFV5G_30555 [Streptomyces sp. NPDC059766]|uniref:hypothetical protein n=1 Tax=Streptomyces sp. NPDC059766 TaxID=3346940 RepID=UPI00364A6614
MRRRPFLAALLGCAALLISLVISAAPAGAADPAAPYAELSPASGQVVPGGTALALDAVFHNTGTTDITDSLIVAVGLRLAPPATALTPDQVTVEWYDSAASVWRAVELTPSETALTGYLSTDDGLPSVGSLPAGGTARISLRVSLVAAVPAGTTLQFVAQGISQPLPEDDPVLLIGKASYSVVEKTTPSNSASTTPSGSATASGSASASATPSASSSATTSASASAVPTFSDAPAPSPLSGGTQGDQLADTGTPGLTAVAGMAALVCAAGIALALTLRLRRDRRG